MTSSQFFLGVSLFALLIVDICCVPVKGGFNPHDSRGSSYSNAAPSFGSNYVPPSSDFSPGVMPNSAPSKGVSTPSYQPVPQPRPSFPQPAVREPAAPGGSSYFSRPVESGYSGSTMRNHPVGSSPPGAAFQPGSRDIKWAVAPPSVFGGEEMPAGTRSVGSSSAEYVSPPGPVYQAGELAQFEESYETGDFQRETEEQGFLPPPPPPPPFSPHTSEGESFSSQPQPESGLGGFGGSLGFYPYYDYMFLTGQYPPGTVTHASSSFEQGMDHWQDVHYVRDYVPQNSGPIQESEPFTGDLAAPQSFQEPQPPLKTGYGHGGTAAGQPGSSYGGFIQPTRSRAGGYNSVKVGY
ncbi:myosin-1-like [Seriola lalandi dorsalis]|uniref:myosin-1-like n=1 Tax=Seriola lalandi dorsalis TaxID=1841481 RepID=UPI000C6F5676|nr:myosin-1-like [Seriola lalandi dorsalis]